MIKFILNIKIDISNGLIKINGYKYYII